MSQHGLITDFVDDLFVLGEETHGIPAKETGPVWVLDRNTGWAQTPRP